MGTTRRIVKHVGQAMVQALYEEGADLRNLARVMAGMAMGYREVIGDDRIQYVRASKDSLTPKMVFVKDVETGQEREVILIDTRSQQRACEIILKVMGLIQSGMNVNVNTAPGGAAGPGAQGSFGDRVLHLSASTATALGAAVALLPPEERRGLMQAIRKDGERAAKVKEVEAG